MCFEDEIMDRFFLNNENTFLNISTTRIACLYIFGILVASFIVILVFVILEMRKITDDRRILGYGKNNIRIFSINYKDDLVYVVDKRNLKTKREKSLEWFYDSVISSDKDKLRKWIEELKNENHKVPHNLEIHVYINSLRTQVFSIFEVDYINYEKGIIHLESHLFPNINKIKKDKNSKIFIKSEEGMPSLFNLNRDHVTVYNIRLFSTYEFDSKTKFRADHLVVTQIVNRLVKFLNSQRYLTLQKSNEIIITDFSQISTNAAIAYGHNFAKQVSRVLFLNSLQNQFSFKIGIVQEKETIKSFQDLVKIAKEMTIFAQDNNISSPVIIYDSALNYQQLSQNTIVDEINQIINYDDLIKKYVPIYNGKENAFLIGYNVDFIPNKSLLSSIQEMQEYAYNNNLSNKLLRTMFNSAHIPLIGTDSMLFMSLQLPYYKAISSLFNEGNELLKNTVFIFEDKDIASFHDEKISVIQVLEQLQDKSISLGISFTTSVLELSDEILSKFSFFIFDERNFQNLLSSPQQQILFQGLVTKLLALGGKIIATNIYSWQSLEYFGKSGFDYFSSELVGVAFDEVPLIEEKKFTKAIETFGLITK